MGGPGSGNHGYRWDTKGTTEETRRLDVRELARAGVLDTPGLYSWAWWRDGEQVGNILVEVQSTLALTLVYSSRVGGGDWRDVRQPVALDWTACHYGARRPWFRCPNCWSRLAVLYLSQGGFYCRKCLGLAYQSTRESAGGRGLAQAQAIRRRLGGSANMLEPFPAKPPRMHWKTYERLHREARAAEYVSNVEMIARFRRWDALLGDRFDFRLSDERE